MKRTLITLLIISGLAGQAWTQNIPTDPIRVQKGEQLFNDNCSKCHAYGKQEIGPSLASITDKREVSWLVRFIKNSQEVIGSGDPYAVYLFKSYSNMVMPDFKNLGDSSILDILAYVQDHSQGTGYDRKKDSVNYYDADIINKADERYHKKQSTEKDYYHAAYVKLPADLQSIQKGEAIFQANCTLCHSFEKRLTGPALASVPARLPHQWLIDFIENPRAVLQSGDDYANYLVSRYPLVMPAFQKELSRADILNVLAYIQYHGGNTTDEAGVNAKHVLTATDTSQAVQTADELPKMENAERSTQPFFKIGDIVLAAGAIAFFVFIYVKVFRKKR